MMKSFKKYRVQKLPLILLFFVSAMLIGCSPEAATVVVAPESGNISSTDKGSLNPSILKVTPGALQSLDYPQTYPTDISYDNPAIAVIFSDVMENDGSEMDSAFSLEDETSTATVPITVSPAGSSKYFTISPVAGTLNPDTVYTLRIYRTAYTETSLTLTSVTRAANITTVVTTAGHGLSTNDIIKIAGIGDVTFNITASVTVVDDVTFTYSNTGADAGPLAGGTVEVISRTLVFNNLVESPASYLVPANPLFVEYRFRTKSGASSDLVHPTVSSTSPPNGEQILYNPVAGVGYLEILFNDNVVPMIAPWTINDQSITLYNNTDMSEVTLNFDFIYSDTNWRNIRIYPDNVAFPFLLPGREYKFTISNSAYPVTDFAGNPVDEKVIVFTTSN